MENLTKQLERIIDVGTRRNPLPMKKGNSIRIGIVAIRYSVNRGYLLFDCEHSEHICLAESKPGALAIAKLYNAKHDVCRAVQADKEYSKHENDCIFFEHVIENTNDSFKSDLAQVRFEVSEARKADAYNVLEALIFT
tara:strand:+ start:19 stop:432 length:414 start_codon:yes stop_codon:yes gene_type:complete